MTPPAPGPDTPTTPAEFRDAISFWMGTDPCYWRPALQGVMREVVFPGLADVVSVRQAPTGRADIRAVGTFAAQVHLRHRGCGDLLTVTTAASRFHGLSVGVAEDAADPFPLYSLFAALNETDFPGLVRDWAHAPDRAASRWVLAARLPEMFRSTGPRAATADRGPEGETFDPRTGVTWFGGHREAFPGAWAPRVRSGGLEALWPVLCDTHRTW